MASINNVQIKALKRFIGHEGEAYQGNVYIDGKKAGFWYQDGNGGCDIFEFNIDALEEKAKEYYTANPPADHLALYGMDMYNDVAFTVKTGVSCCPNIKARSTIICR